MKLSKNVVINSIGAKKIHWMIQDELKGIVSGGWLLKDGDYWYGFDGNGVQIPLLYNQRKKQDLIDAINEHVESLNDGSFEAEQERINQSKRAYAFAEYKLIEYKNSLSVEYKENEVIDIDFFCRNKQDSLGYYFEEIYNYPEQIKRMKACVEKVIRINPSEYDEYIEDFWSSDVANRLKSELKGSGGSGMFDDDDVVYVVVIVADNRKSLIVNPEGFDYPRYIAMAV